MATITSTASGNFSAGATWVGGVAPGANDDAVAATGHTIVIDTDVTVISFQQAGTGKFTLGNGRSVVGNVIANAGTFTSGGTVDVICGAGESATITGNVTGASTTTSNTAGIVVSGVGTLTLNGTVTGSAGNGSSEANGSAGVYTNVSCTITVNGAVAGGTGSHKRGVQAGSSSNAAITINGNVDGGNGINSYGVWHAGASGTITATATTIQGGSQLAIGIYHTGASGTITATATTIQGGLISFAYGIFHTGASGTITATATTIQGGGGNPSAIGIYHTGTSGTITATATTIQGGGGPTAHGIRHDGASGNITSSGEAKANGTASSGIDSSATSSANGVFHTGSITDSTAGRVAIRALFLRVASGTGTTTHATPGSPTGSANQRFSADQILGVPAVGNVRSGTTYGNPATLTGTLAVPSASQVAVGVAVDNTVGTAVLTESTLRAAVGLASANLDAQFAAINVDFTPVLNRLPSALVSGRIDASVGAMAANTITQASIAASALDDKGNWLKPTTAGRTLDVTPAGGVGQVDTVTLVTQIDLLQTELVLDHGPVNSSTATTVTYSATKLTTPAALVGATVSIYNDDASELRVGQARIVTNAVSAGGSSVTLTVDRAWNVNPQDGGPDKIVLWAFGNASVAEMRSNTLTASALATDAVNEIADGVLIRNVSNVETVAPEHSLTTLILANLENNISGTTLTIKRTDGTTTHVTKTLTTSPAGDKITGIQ